MFWKYFLFFNIQFYNLIYFHFSWWKWTNWNYSRCNRFISRYWLKSIEIKTFWFNFVIIIQDLKTNLILFEQKTNFSKFFKKFSLKIKITICNILRNWTINIIFIWRLSWKWWRKRRFWRICFFLKEKKINLFYCFVF